MSAQRKGCSCKAGCETSRCGCRSRGIKCDVNCACINTEDGCGNLAYCGCKTDCSTKRCSCQKSGINCLPGLCKCNSLQCLNKNHQVISDRFAAKQEETTNNFMSYEQYNTTQVSVNKEINYNIQYNIFNIQPNSNPVSNLVEPPKPSSVAITEVKEEPQNNNYEELVNSFVKHYFTVFINQQISPIASLFTENSKLLFQNEVIEGSLKCAEKLTTFGAITVKIENLNFHILADGIGINLKGFIQNNIPFVKMIHLYPSNSGSWFIKAMKFQWGNNILL